MDRNRGKTIAFKVGDGDKSNWLQITQELQEKRYNINHLCTDGNPTYSYYKLANQHYITKAETSLVESYNSSMRDMLARLNRKTKRYSKCKEMLRLTLVMFFNRQISEDICLYN